MALPPYLRAAARGCRLVLQSQRCPGAAALQTGRSFSTESSNIVVDMDSQKGVATMKLNKKPVNSLNLEFLNDIVNTVDSLEKDSGCRGMIITSNNPGIFSAGLDILEMYNPNKERLAAFWSNVQEMWLRLYGSNLIVMAAINGHSPAGGCMIAMMSDYRVMAAGKYTIGLNETLLGIVAPIWFQMTMANTVGHRETERGLQLGHLYSGEEALRVGMIDELVPEADVYSTTQAQMDKWLKIPDIARQSSKHSMRKPTLDYLLQRRKEDVDSFVKFITRDSIQKYLGGYLEALKQKAAKK